MDILIIVEGQNWGDKMASIAQDITEKKQRKKTDEGKDMNGGG